MTALTGVLGDGPIAGDIISGVASTSLAQAVGVVDAATYYWIAGAVAQDTVRFNHAFTGTATLHPALSDGVKIASLLQVGQAAAITQNVNLAASFLGQLNFVIREVMRLREAYGPTAKTGLTISEATRIVEILALPAYGRMLAENIELADGEISYAYIAGVTFIEQMLFADQLSDRVVFRLQFTDDVDLDDDPLANFIYSTGFADNVVADVLYQSPGVGVTAWCINTRSNAVTEYKNFAFNSVVPFGRKYVAADESGIYELNGARDLAVNIVAELAGGYLQINGAKFTGFKAAYIGVRGQGNYLLKLVGGDGTVRVYRALSNPGLMTTKVDIGKGIRTRYIAWELVNEDGQDFDLDTIEFIPMKSARRV